LAHELYGDKIAGNFLELNASDERGIEVVRGRIKDFARSVSLGDAPFKLIFLDEGDALTADAQQALRRTMEANSSVTRFIISANYSSRIIEPIQSRCSVFRFAPLNDKDMRKTMEHVAKAEKLKMDDDSYEAVFYVSEGDMRRALNVMQGCAMHSNHITSELVHKISSRAMPKEVREMVNLAIEGKFQAARENLDKLIINYGLSGEDILYQIYREVGKMEVPEKRRIKLIEIVGEYNFRLIQGANERIQLEALLAQFAKGLE
jgi:replication factor C small subunit